MVDDRAVGKELWTRIDFSQSGNSAEFRGQGWSGQERIHIWTIGNRSELIFEKIPHRGGLAVRLEAWPFMAMPAPRAQPVTVHANGQKVAHFELTKRDLFEFVIPETAIQGQNRLLLEFRHPNAARPSDSDPNNDDHRVLALAFTHLELRRVAGAAASAPVEPAYREADPVPTIPHASWPTPAAANARRPTATTNRQGPVAAFFAWLRSR